MNVLVIADDLTGCNATGALYSRFGLRAMSISRPEQISRFADSTDVLLVNTASRHLPPAQAYAAVRAAVEAGGDVPLIVKRVDTTLRGNLGTELDAVLDALAPRAQRGRLRVIAVPAFPDAGRVTIGGSQLLDGRPLDRTDVARDPFAPVNESRIKTLLQRQTARTIGEIALAEVEQGAESVMAQLCTRTEDIVVCDATRNEHLRTVARAVAEVSMSRHTQWVVLDSGPFGAAVAAEVELRAANDVPGVVVAIVGSRTPRTREQLLHSEVNVGARWVDLDSQRPDPAAAVAELSRLAHSGAPVVGVRVTGDDGATDEILSSLAAIAARSVAELQPAGLYASGGEVAACVTSALDADGFAIERQLLPLAVGGRLVGGPHDGLPFATKGGLIGGADATSLCLEDLLTSRVRRAITSRGVEASSMHGTGDYPKR